MDRHINQEQLPALGRAVYFNCLVRNLGLKFGAIYGKMKTLSAEFLAQVRNVGFSA